MTYSEIVSNYMVKAMNEIPQMQNLPENIDRLAAQRHLYTIAKCYSISIFMLCIVLPILLSFLIVLFPSYGWLSKLIVVISFLITFVKLILGSIKTDCQNLAARIQQLFDCDLFLLPWNEALCGNKPLPEEVFKYKQGVDTSQLYNWYEKEIGTLSLEKGALVCMRTNVVYDQGIRKSYLRVCTATATVASFIVFFVGLLTNPSFWALFIYGVVPLMPIAVWYIDMRKQHIKNMKALNKLQILITSSIENAIKSNIVSCDDLMTIQNFMFIHRSTSYTIPDVVYRWKRDEFEKATSYSVHQIVSNLK